MMTRSLLQLLNMANINGSLHSPGEAVKMQSIALVLLLQASRYRSPDNLHIANGESVDRVVRHATI